MTTRSATAHQPRAILILLLVLALAVSVMLPGPAQAQETTTGSATFDGDPATTERIVASDPQSAALEVSRARFAGSRRAAHAVLATEETFADSLAGAALTTDGPLLLTPAARLADGAAAELSRVLVAGQTVYVLGGEQALSPQVVADVEALGFTVRRLAGQTRVETALAVADEVRRLTPSSTVLLARADGPAGNPTAAWADSMTGGALAAAARLPIIVTPTADLHPAVVSWLTAAAPTTTLLLGGEAALSPTIDGRVPGARRLAGPERTATAAEIASAPEWPRNAARRFVVLDGGRADGWAYGLSAAGIAADAGAPPLMVVGGVGPATRREVSTCGPAAVDLVIMGDEQVISATIADALTTFDGQACADTRARLNTFPSCQATLDFFVDEALERVGPYGLDAYYYGAPEILVDFVAPGEGPQPQPSSEQAAGNEATDSQASDSQASAPQAESISADGAGGSDDVSSTNVQEVGVDEPDRIKLTAQAAYIATGTQVQVVGLDPQAAPRLLTTIDVPGGLFGQELLLHDDVLLVLGRGDGYVQPSGDAPRETSFAPPFYYPDPTTHVTRYDVSNPANPVLLDATSIDGDYRSARMIDGVVRLVTSSNPSGLHFVFPADASQEAADAALAHNQQVIRDTTLQTWLPQIGEGADSEPLLGCDDVYVPPGFSGISTVLVSTVDVASSATPSSAAGLLATGETIYASTDRLVVSSSQWGIWNDARPASVTTLLHSFDISDPEATSYVASGEVDGYVLNSFAISERDRYYRIATTTEPPWTGAPTDGQTDNGITVLTEGGGELFEVGRVFGLGLGERIFAVRYLGDIAAVVTFRQTDPLYLVDLTNPAAPAVTGELKIPGVSRYLHPVGSDHLIGVGQDGDDDGTLTGLQVSLFDISNRANPTRVDSLEFGPGDSPVEYDHKAFLYWTPLGRAIVPSQLYGQGFEDFRAAAQAIDVDTTSGTLRLVGQVSQPTQDGQQQAIDRTFVAGGVLYTLSYTGVSAHDLVSLSDRGYLALPTPQGGGCCIAID